MVTRSKIEDLLLEYDYEGVKFFTSPDYADAFLGVVDDGEQYRAVYSFDKMVDCLLEDMSYEEAAEFIDFNCRSLGDGCPLILDSLEPLQ